MINIDALTIKAFLAENYDFLFGARVQKIQQPNRKEIVFHMRNNGESRKFYININPSFYHVCFMSPENEKKRNLKIPKSAAMFCMLLRKYIDGAKIIEVTQPANERIIEFYFDHYDVLNESSKLCLSIELMGKHSNIVLYNYDTNVIIGCAHNVGAEKSRDRELAGLLPYIYPPKQKKHDLLIIDFEKFTEIMGTNELAYEQILTEDFYLFTRPLTKLLLEKFSPLAKNMQKFYLEAKNLFLLENIKPNVKNDFSEFSLYPQDENMAFNSVNTMLDEYFTYQQTKVLCQNLKNKLFSIVNHQIKKITQIKNKQEFQLQQMDKALVYKKKGDILMANLYQIAPSTKSIELDDYETGGKIIIELDSLLSPIENANRYYKLYKKTKSAYDYSVQMLEETNVQLNYYLEQKFFIESANSISELEDISFELKGEEVSKNKPSKKAAEMFIAPKNIKGYKVYVGKNSKQNDFLLSKVSSSEDIWFHPLNIPGAHVILKKNNPKEIVPDVILFEAAKLTKENSSAKTGSKVPIVYTLRKYVKKANSKSLGFVTYKNEIEILVD